MKIRRLLGILLSLMLVIALAVSFAACVDDNKKDDPDPDPTPTPTPNPDPDPDPDPVLKDIEGITFEGAEFVYDGEEHKIEIAGTLPEGVSVSYENSKATDAGTYEAKATLKGEGYNTLTLTAQLVITEAEMGLTFTKGEFVYDGTEHEITVSGTLPEGATVEYTSNKATDAGTYTASVTVTCKNYKTFTASVPLIIAKADLKGLLLESLTVVYDGNEHEITVSGTLPEGVTVEYTGNKATEVGSHPVTAIVSGKNYNTVELTAFIVIEEAPVVPDQDIVGVTLDPAGFVYDGTEKSLAVSGTLPEGVTATYAGNGKVNVGTYTVTAVLSGKGYKTLTLTAELKITKATLTGITLEDGTFTYADGVYHSLEIAGTLPDGVTVEYTGNNVTYAGTYKVTAVISGDNYETLVLEATLYVKGSNGSGLLTPIHPF